SSLHPTSCSDLYTLPLPDALPILVHLTGDPALFARRRAARGAARDTHRPADSPPAAPRVPHIAVDAQLTPEQQRFRVLRELGQRVPVDTGAAVFAAEYDAVLFDVDGVLADSTASVLRSWDRFGAERGLPSTPVATNHGRPARALVEQLLAPGDVADGMRRIEQLEIEDA